MQIIIITIIIIVWTDKPSTFIWLWAMPKDEQTPNDG